MHHCLSLHMFIILHCIICCVWSLVAEPCFVSIFTHELCKRPLASCFILKTSGSLSSCLQEASTLSETYIICASVRLCVYVSVSLCLCVSVSLCLCVCVSVCLCATCFQERGVTEPESRGDLCNCCNCCNWSILVVFDDWVGAAVCLNTWWVYVNVYIWVCVNKHVNIRGYVCKYVQRCVNI